MANGIKSIGRSSSDIEEDDLFPALFAEAYPLPAAVPLVRDNVWRLPATFDRNPWIAASKERVA
jgi:hypothetical protein